MKNLIILVLAVSIFSACNAGADVPEVVKKSFTEKFPTATNVKWEKEGKSEFEAEFKMNGTEMSASFSPDGIWTTTETTIKITDLPKSVAAAIKTNYAEAIVKEAEQVDSAAKDMMYEVEIKQGKESFELVISADGSSITKEEEEED